MANLPLLPPFLPLVDSDGSASVQMQQFWQSFEQAITQNIADIANTLTQAVAAQNAAIAANTAAVAAQATADGKLDQSDADGLYVHQDNTTPWTAPTGTLDRSGFAAYVAPSISNPPTQAEVQTLANATMAASQHLAALISDLKGNNTLA